MASSVLAYCPLGLKPDIPAGFDALVVLEGILASEAAPSPQVGELNRWLRVGQGLHRQPSAEEVEEGWASSSLPNKGYHLLDSHWLEPGPIHNLTIFATYR